jgi:NMD protein affecting ribosome stability and mRNA decay
MKTNSRPPAYRQAKRDVLLREARHDSYKSTRKPLSPRVCPGCKALFQDGRWHWAQAPASAIKQTCPACKRIRDDFPAGYVTLKGEFLATHRDEVLHLVHHHEAREKSEHPLQRIMKIVDTGEGILITTTDVHLARGIGDALHHAYRGTLDYHYNPEQTLIRVQWER